MTFMTYNQDMIHSLSTADFKRKLSDCLARVAYKKETLVITRRGRPVAQVSPVTDAPCHLANVQGWLDDSDPFFGVLRNITATRVKHTPRVWKNK